MVLLSEWKSLPEYIVLSAVGGHRVHVLDRFIESVKAFDPEPEEIVLCIDWDEFDLWRLRDRDDVTTLITSEAIGFSRGSCKRVGASKNLLSKYFTDSPYEWALIIDSDIICPPELPELMLETIEDENLVGLCHSYLGRGQQLWSGGGLMMVHKDICKASTFYAADPGPDIRGGSEDFTFLAIARGISSIIGEPMGRTGGIPRRDLVDTLHFIRPDMTDEEAIEELRIARSHT